MQWQAVPLVGEHVELVPLQASHIDDLWAVAQDASIWRYMPFAAGTYQEFQDYVNSTLAQAQHGTAMPFVTLERETAAPVGATSFLAVNAYHRRLEIGATWITPGYQRSVVNTEAKLLQLTDAFERLGCNRVELKTDSLNLRSQQAIARIGAREEGTFRNHMVLPDGRLRHTMWYSIVRDEWPEVRSRLRARLGR